jgi:hypothetical protein
MAYDSELLLKNKSGGPLLCQCLWIMTLFCSHHSSFDTFMLWYDWLFIFFLNKKWQWLVACLVPNFIFRWFFFPFFISGESYTTWRSKGKILSWVNQIQVFFSRTESTRLFLFHYLSLMCWSILLFRCSCWSLAHKFFYLFAVLYSWFIIRFMFQFVCYIMPCLLCKNIFYFHFQWQ